MMISMKRLSSNIMYTDNMTVDLNRGIKGIEYDVNNRPVSVTFSTSPAEQRTEYLRDASGRKLRTTYQISRYASLGPGGLGQIDTLELNPGIGGIGGIGGLKPLSSPGLGDASGSLRDDLPLVADDFQWQTSYTRDYCGDIIYKDDEIERILTDNGYAVLDARTGGYKYYYYVKDYQCNIRAVLDEAGNVVESNGYYPYGMPYADNYTSVQPYKYGGKELDRTNGLDMYDYGARWYDMIVPHFITIDPLAEKYPSISPYAYCAGNPIRYIDPTGKEIKPAGTAELIMIQNTLPKEARNYVKFDNNGLIDRTLLNSYRGESLNFNNLKTIANSNYMVEVKFADSFTYMKQDCSLGVSTMSYNAFDPQYDLESDKDLQGKTINGVSTGESGFLGKTLFPDKNGVQNSPNGNIIVIINKNLSPAGAAENYSHEANGHVLLYILTGGNRKEASHQPVNGQWIEGNKILMDMIIKSKQETIKNMQR